jgi:hypothetical protein
MAIALTVGFNRGQTLGPTDLYVTLKGQNGQFVDPYSITWSVYKVLDDGTEELISALSQEAFRQSVGYYYTGWKIPDALVDGNYLVRWAVSETVGQTSPSYVTENFRIEPFEATTAPEEKQELAELVMSLRVLLRDNNPDRNYHFNPPASEDFTHQQTQTFGYIWTDDELLEYLQMSVDTINSFEPRTGFTITNFDQEVRTLLLHGAALQALIALSLNWVVEEFSYSIGGISLTIDKASKYMSLKSNLEELFNKELEAYKKSIHVTKGLQQPRFNPGARALFGPHVGRNILSARTFLNPTGR